MTHRTTGSVPVAAAGDHVCSTAMPAQVPVFFVVVGMIGIDHLWPESGPSASSSDTGNGVGQRHQLGDVVAVAIGKRHRQWGFARIGEHVVLRARPGAVYRARPCFGPPRMART
ncbi:hypothetical protein BJ969_003139 [Saccharopolyspora gloriosae]|uniref:Uncharacterized protein n=1 Tax=Saccharopolyspora gloriosae TaxID=455344 RepID=A0A840NGB7_9PSEU|nr:hypothetical protein [Saccharopolyspora gloriosae]